MIISCWLVCTAFTQAMIDHLLLSDWLLFAPPRIDIEWLKLLKDWISRQQFNLHWVYNNIIQDFKTTSKNQNIEPCDFEVSNVLGGVLNLKRFFDNIFIICGHWIVNKILHKQCLIEVLSNIIAKYIWCFYCHVNLPQKVL